jgi:hypothetical protein
MRIYAKHANFGVGFVTQLSAYPDGVYAAMQYETEDFLN